MNGNNLGTAEGTKDHDGASRDPIGTISIPLSSLDRRAPVNFFGVMLGFPVSDPARVQSMPAEDLRPAFEEMYAWADRQTVPQTHPMWGWIKRVRYFAAWFFWHVDDDRHDATLMFHDLTVFCALIDARIAEPYAATGLKIHAAGPRGSERPPEKIEEQKARWTLYQADVNALAGGTLSYRAIMMNVASKRGVHFSTIKRRTSNPRQPQ
jgi:hypothetical protein